MGALSGEAALSLLVLFRMGSGHALAWQGMPCLPPCHAVAGQCCPILVSLRCRL